MKARVLLALVIAAVSTPGGASAQTSGPMALLKIVSLGTRAGMSTGAPSASFTSQLHVGESGTGSLVAGSPDEGDLGAQWGGMSGAANPDEQKALHLWRATLQATKIADEEITFVVDWQRFDANAGRYDVKAGDRRTITLKDGERQALDFVSSSAARPGETSSVLVQVEASIVDPAPLASTTLGYDLWLVDQEPNGQQVTRHMEMAGRQREAIDFRFVPIGWLSDGSPVADGGHPDLLVEVSGTIKGRLQADGSVLVAVTPSRNVRVGAASGSTGYREKVLTAKPGETVRMDIPPSGPHAARTHKTSLSLTVRPW